MYETAYPVAAVHQTLVSLYKTRHVTSILASAGHTCICKGIPWRALEMVEYWFSSCQSSDPFFTHIVFGVSIGFVHLDANPRLLRLRKACPQLPPKRPKLHSSTSPLSWLPYSMLEKHEVAQVMVINDILHLLSRSVCTGVSISFFPLQDKRFDRGRWSPFSAILHLLRQKTLAWRIRHSLSNREPDKVQISSRS